MGGKRPDQHNIDPAEAGSTDDKWRHGGHSQDERLASEEKQRLKANPKDQPMIPRESVNPALRDLHVRKTGGEMTDDERVDEASEESFPASDPPAQP